VLRGAEAARSPEVEMEKEDEEQEGLAIEGSRSLRVLLAEDDQVSQKLTVRLLEKDGHSVEVVETGRAAVAAWTQGTFDLILMDVQMPEVNGFSATRRIREREEDAHVPIVALTARASEEDREKCLRAGMDDYLPKPVGSKALKEVITDVVSGTTTGNEVGSSSASEEED
jgi:CheY-like chemotaxis protein